MLPEAVSDDLHNALAGEDHEEHVFHLLEDQVRLVRVLGGERRVNGQGHAIPQDRDEDEELEGLPLDDFDELFP